MPTNARRLLIALLVCTAVLPSACSEGEGSASTTSGPETSTTGPAVPSPCGSTDPQLVALVRAASDAAHEAQLEMILSAASMADEAPDALEPSVDADLIAQRGRTDEAIATFLASVDDAAIDHDAERATDLVGSIRSANEPIDGLNVTRVAVDDVQVTTTFARQSAAALAQSFLDVIAATRWCLQDGTAANQLIDLLVIEGYKGATAELGALMMSITASGEIDELDRDGLEALVAARDGVGRDLHRIGFEDYRDKLREEAGLRDRAARAAIDELVKTPDNTPLSITVQEWRPLAVAQLENIRFFSTERIDAMSGGGVEPCTAADEELADLVAAASGAAHEVQLEALLSIASMATQHTDLVIRGDLDAQRILADEAVTAFVATARSMHFDVAPHDGLGLAPWLLVSEDAMDDIDDAREAIDDPQTSSSSGRNRAASIGASFQLLIANARWCAASGRVVNQLLDLALLSSYEAAAAELNALVAAITTAGSLTQPEREDLERLVAGQEAAVLLLSDLGSASLVARLRSATLSDLEAASAIEQVLGTPDDAPVPVTGEEWLVLAEAHLGELHAVEVELIDLITDIEL